MSRRPKSNATGYVIGAHALAIIAMAAGGAFKGCASKPDKPEILAVVGIEPLSSFQASPPSVSEPDPVPPPPTQEVTPPAPVEPPPKAIEPPPKPVPPKPVEPVKPPPKPLNSVEAIRKKIQDQKKIVRKTEAETQKVTKPVPEVKRPVVPDAKEISKQLFKNKQAFNPNTERSSAAAAAQVNQEMGLILGMLKGKCDAGWQKPVGLSSSAGQIVSITFTISRSGSVIRRTFKRRSGIAALDNSAMQAAERITFVKAFPAASKVSQEDFTIEFELTPGR